LVTEYVICILLSSMG